MGDDAYKFQLVLIAENAIEHPNKETFLFIMIRSQFLFETKKNSANSMNVFSCKLIKRMNVIPVKSNFNYYIEKKKIENN